MIYALIYAKIKVVNKEIWNKWFMRLKIYPFWKTVFIGWRRRLSSQEHFSEQTWRKCDIFPTRALVGVELFRRSWITICIWLLDLVSDEFSTSPLQLRAGPSDENWRMETCKTCISGDVWATRRLRRLKARQRRPISSLRIAGLCPTLI